MRINFGSRIGKLVEGTEATVQENADLFKKKIEYPNTKKEIKRFMKNISLGRYHYISFAVTTGYKSLNYQDKTDNLGYTAVHIASAKGHADTVNELLKYKADPNIRNSVGDLPIHLAWNFWRQPCENKEERLEQEKKTTEVVHFLLKWGAFVNSMTSDTGDTPLHFACRLGPIDVVKVLLGFKGDILLRNKAGATPIDVAAENGNEDILNLLNCWNGIRSQLVNVDFIIQWKDFLSNYEAVISKGKDVETVIFEMNMRENIRKQELLAGAKFQVDDALLTRSKNEAVMHQKLTSHQAALKRAEEEQEEENQFHCNDGGKTVSSEGQALGPKGTSMYSADIPDWMKLMNVPVRLKKKKKKDGDPVEKYYSNLVEKNRPKDSQIIRDKYITAHKARVEREGAFKEENEETDPCGDFVKMQYAEAGSEEIRRPSTNLRNRRMARARAIKMDAKFELFTERPCTASPLFISKRTANAPLKGTEEENSFNRYFSTPTRTRNLVVTALEDRKKLGIRQYTLSDSQKLTALGSYSQESNCLADPTERQKLYDRLLDENDERTKLAEQNRKELNNMLQTEQADGLRGTKVDMVPSEKRLRFVAKELVPPNRELSALEELKRKIKRDQDKLIAGKKKDCGDDGEQLASSRIENEETKSANDQDHENESQSTDFDAKLKELQNRNSNKKLSKKVVYGKGRLRSLHRMKEPLEKVWGNVNSSHQLKTAI